MSLDFLIFGAMPLSLLIGWLVLLLTLLRERIVALEARMDALDSSIPARPSPQEPT